MKRHTNVLLLLFLGIALGACGSGTNPESKETTDVKEPTDNHGTEGHGGAESHDEHNGEHDEEDNDHGDDDSERNRVKLSTSQLEQSGIKLSTVASASIRESIQLYGVIAPNAERVREVSARFPGMVLDVARKVGDAVREGETLAVIESNESLRSYKLKSPMSGVITERHANPGEQADQQSLFTVADLSSVWVELSLFPRDASRVKLGQDVIVNGPDMSKSANGRVIYVAPFGRTANQTLSARVLLDNAQGVWAPGLNVTAEVTISESLAPVAVSTTALQYLESLPVLFVLHDDEFEARPVRLGRSDSTTVEIASGAVVGEQYAATNTFILKAELGKGSAEHGH